jgi:hypothetical protein
MADVCMSMSISMSDDDGLRKKKARTRPEQLERDGRKTTLGCLDQDEDTELVYDTLLMIRIFWTTY